MSIESIVIRFFFIMKYSKYGFVFFLNFVNGIKPHLKWSFLKLQWFVNWRKKKQYNSINRFNDCSEAKPAQIKRNWTIFIIYEPSKRNIYTFIQQNQKLYFYSSTVFLIYFIFQKLSYRLKWIFEYKCHFIFWRGGKKESRKIFMRTHSSFWVKFNHIVLWF